METARRPILSNAHVALMVFMASEVMLFGALMSSHLIFKAGAESWPPADLPRLPLGLTGANTIGLLLSGVAVWRALAAIRGNSQAAFRFWWMLTQLLGMVFLGIQGVEWSRLVLRGLTLRAGMYGGIFYAMVGLHALHVLGAVIWLCEIARRARQGRYTASAHLGPSLCGIYWSFVVALWMVIFGLVYLPEWS